MVHIYDKFSLESKYDSKILSRKRRSAYDNISSTNKFTKNGFILLIDREREFKLTSESRK